MELDRTLNTNQESIFEVTYFSLNVYNIAVKFMFSEFTSVLPIHTGIFNLSPPGRCSQWFLLVCTTVTPCLTNDFFLLEK